MYNRRTGAVLWAIGVMLFRNMFWRSANGLHETYKDQGQHHDTHEPAPGRSKTVRYENGQYASSDECGNEQQKIKRVHLRRSASSHHRRSWHIVPVTAHGTTLPSRG